MVLQLILSGLTVGALYALIAAGIAIVFNVTGILNLAQGEFAVLSGLFAITLYNQGLPMWMVIILAVLLSGIVAGLVERLFIRKFPRANVLAALILVMGISIIFRGVNLLFWGPDVRTLPAMIEGFLYIGTASIAWQSILSILLCLIFYISIKIFFDKTYYGKSVQANVMNSVAARLMGISPAKLSFWAFVITGALTGLAGVIITPITGMYYAIGLPLVVKGLIVSIISGLSNVSGCILVGFRLGILESLTAGYISSGYSNIISVVLLILILFIRPAGIFGKEEVKRV